MGIVFCSRKTTTSRCHHTYTFDLCPIHTHTYKHMHSHTVPFSLSVNGSVTSMAITFQSVSPIHYHIDHSNNDVISTFINHCFHLLDLTTFSYLWSNDLEKIHTGTHTQRKEHAYCTHYSTYTETYTPYIQSDTHPEDHCLLYTMFSY